MGGKIKISLADMDLPRWGHELTEDLGLIEALVASMDQVTPQEDAVAPAGRMLLEKVYQGDAVGTGTGQMISKRTDGGTAVYYAIEEFSGAVQGKKGGFTLVHRGHMNSDSQSLEVLILEGSGSGELQGISGSMLIEQDEGGHRYELSFEL